MVNIVLATDANNLWGVAVTVRSVLETCSSLCNIYIICVDLQPNDYRLLQDSWQTANAGTIEFISFDRSKLASFRSTLYLKSKAAYARLFIDECLPQLTRCLYLDTDLLVCADIQELYEIPLSGHITACVMDSAVSNPNQLARFRDELKLRQPSLYFNSGVMLIDLDAWRQYQIGSQALQVCMEMYDFLSALDQDVLNIVLQDRWLNLDPKWNILKYAVPKTFSEGIIHLCGKVKPWHPDYQEDGFKQQFFNVLDRTAFSGKRPAQLLGLGRVYKKLSRLVPTMEMAQGKLRRLLLGSRTLNS